MVTRTYRSLRSIAVLAVLLGLTACSEEDSTAPTEQPGQDDGETRDELTPNDDGMVPTYLGGVKSILDGRCATCHVEGGVGPFPLTTYDEAKQYASLIAYDVAERIMPPFLAQPGLRAYKFDASLSDAQIQLIQDWADAGAPEGDAAHAVDVDLSVETVDLEREDMTVEMPIDYTPVNTPDEYRCFPIDWPLEETAYVTGYRAEPGNLEIAHHLAAYLIPPENAAQIDEMEAAEETPGYSCFGAPTLEGHDGDIPFQFLGIWAPGIDAIRLPENSGLEIRPGSKVVLQMHYSVLEAGPSPDRSRIVFQIDDSVEDPGGYVPFFNVGWVFNPSTMLIPAGETGVEHSFRAKFDDLAFMALMVPNVDTTHGVYIHSSMPHLHKRGQLIGLKVHRADGSVEDLIYIPRWDFDWQREYFYEEPVFVAPDDEVEIYCQWDNSEAAQPTIDGERLPPQDVEWGDGSFEEMCIATMFVTGASP